MANEILKFKKGLHANLPTELSNGSFYVTTDERALYVDLVAPIKDADGKPTSTTELQRIRLSDIIQYNSYADFKNAPPPYSTTAIYYIVDDNALLKYLGEGKGWQQINSVSDVTADLDSLAKRVTANETSIGNNATAIEKLNKDVYGNEDGSLHATDGLIKAVAALEAADEEIKTNVQTNASNITTINGEITDIKGDITGIDGRVTTLETELPKVSNRVTTLETWKNTADTDITNLKNSVGVNTSDTDGSGTVYERLANLRTQISNNDDDITALLQADTALGNRVTATEGSINTINGSITTINGDITSIKSRLDTAEGDIDNLESWKSTASGQINSLNTTVGLHTTTLESHATSIGNNAAAIVTLTNTVGDENSGLVQKVNTNTTNIQTNADAIEDINDTIGTAGEGQTDKTLYQLIAANKTASDANATNHNTLKGRVDTIEGTVTNHGTDISDLQTWQTTAQGQITALQAKDTTIEGKITSIEGVNTTQTQNIQKNASDISALTGRVAANEASITSLGNTKLDKSTYEDGIANLEDTLNNKILAANAMRYVGTTADDTPDYYTGETGYRIGDTWVASAKITGTAFTANPGDLIIAHSTDGTEDADGYIIAGNITWQVVNTGYNESHRDSLTGTDNKISLTSYTGTDDLGTITFEGQGAVKIDISANKAIISTEWEDF